MMTWEKHSETLRNMARGLARDAAQSLAKGGMPPNDMPSVDRITIHLLQAALFDAFRDEFKHRIANECLEHHLEVAKKLMIKERYGPDHMGMVFGAPGEKLQVADVDGKEVACFETMMVAKPAPLVSFFLERVLNGIEIGALVGELVRQQAEGKSDVGVVAATADAAGGSAGNAGEAVPVAGVGDNAADTPG
jgi:hypothetical protein